MALISSGCVPGTQVKSPKSVDEKALDFLAEFGFNFVRIPVDYRFWTTNFDYFHPDETIFDYMDRYLEACKSRGIHMSLNLHRAPGYCTNRNDLEKHNLWLDEIAQNAFVFLWETFACRYKDVPGESLSFDLVNEPPNPGDHGMTRKNHANIILRTVAAIRAIDPDREIVIDGLGGGYLAMPELAELGVSHSGRGYHPMPISHHKASLVVRPYPRSSPTVSRPDLAGSYMESHRAAKCIQALARRGKTRRKNSHWRIWLFQPHTQ